MELELEGLRVMNDVCIGIDLGGTFIKFGLLDSAGSLVGAVTSVPTPTAGGGDALVESMAAGVGELLASCAETATPRAVGIGAPGPLDLAAGEVVAMPNLPGLEKYPLRDAVARRLGLPAMFENDANAAAYGEYVGGVGCAGKDMVMLTLGTGVGSGILHEGRVIHGSYGLGGELGHMIVEPHGRPCGCGQRGCLEQYASAASIARFATPRVEQASATTTLSALLAANGAITSRDMVEASLAGDPLAQELWDEMIFYLAIGCVNICRIFDPSQIVLAGGLTKAGEALLNPLKKAIAAESWTMSETHTDVLLAKLGSDAGAIGAAGLAWQMLENQPH